jgi:hypothetical protein
MAKKQDIANTATSCWRISPFLPFSFIIQKKSGQEFVHFSSAWPIKMNDKTKLKDLKFKNEILFESEKRGKNKIKG